MDVSEIVDWLFLAGRLLFCWLFVNAGINHFRYREMMTGYAASKKLPMAGFNVMLTGLLQLVAVVLIATGIWMDLGFLLLVIFLLSTAFLMHNFWTIDDPMARSSDQIQFNKDLALAGAALMLFALTGAIGDGFELTLGEPLFDLDE